MEIREHKVEFLGETPYTNPEIYESIKIAGTTCYQSWEKTKKSGVEFAQMLFDSKHLAMLEFSNIVVRTDSTFYSELLKLVTIQRALSFHTITEHDGYYIISGNITAWINLLDVLDDQVTDYLSSVLHKDYPEIFKSNPVEIRKPRIEVLKDPKDIPLEHKRFTFRIQTNLSISHEIVRHRTLSFAQESTRWIRYNNLIFIPCIDEDDEQRADFLKILESIESYYIKFKDKKNDKKRGILPKDLKTEICTCGDIKAYKHLISLRDKPPADPQFQRIAVQMDGYLSDKSSTITN